MSWSSYHSRSERLASEAEVLFRAGESERSIALYGQAARAELSALDALDPAKTRTLGITAVSAVALFYKAREYPIAEKTAHRLLGSHELPSFAVQQLHELLQGIWSAEAASRAGIRFVPGDVLVSVKGGLVVYGGAPLDLIVRKVEEVQAMYFRTVEMLLGLPLRKRGSPQAEVQEIFRPWLFQTTPGSYQFAVRVQEPEQTDLFPQARPKVEQVAAKFLEIIKASATDPEGALPQVVDNPEYRTTFLKLTRNLAPTGKSFERIDIRDASLPAARAVSLGKETRDEVNAALRKTAPPVSDSLLEPPTTLRGVLRALHLDQDWIEIAIRGRADHIKIYDAGDVLDDVVGSLVNRDVVVTYVRRSGRPSFIDIEGEE